MCCRRYSILTWTNQQCQERWKRSALYPKPRFIGKGRWTWALLQVEFDGCRCPRTCAIWFSIYDFFLLDRCSGPPFPLAVISLRAKRNKSHRWMLEDSTGIPRSGRCSGRYPLSFFPNAIVHRRFVTRIALMQATCMTFLKCITAASALPRRWVSRCIPQFTAHF